MVQTKKANTFSVRLGTANTFTGGTTVNAGGGILEAAAANALGGTSGVIIHSGGTLLLSGAGDRVYDAAGITLAGGTLNTGGLSEAVGALTLTANSYIDFGAGSSLLTFADSHSADWGASG